MEFVEHLLEQAASQGAFDAGDQAGRPLDIRDAEPGWWGRREAERIRREDGAQEVVAEVEHRLGQVWALPSETLVRTRVEQLNHRLTEAGADDASLDSDEIVEVWKRMARLRMFRRPSPR